ncbi:MAG: L-dopachrome tautomerase-related protein [Gammaproteobacteria bacterium]|nr:L-dopachrome tautomerase-related protein [Gammaproteobacteria bacterium]
MTASQCLARLLLPLLACSPLPSLATDAATPGQVAVVAELAQGPGNITVTPGGDVLVSLHQFYGHDVRVGRVDSTGGIREFAAAAGLDSVLGLQADADGVVWLLDNAMRDGGTRRLVGWHARDDRLVADIDLGAASVPRSFLNDLAVDLSTQTAYVADPAGGADAAIIVVDLAKGTARRVLQGHVSVVPEDIDLVIDGTPVRIRQDDGSEVRPRVGVNPIALDRDAAWLYFGPMHGLALYRVRTAALRDPALPADALAAAVERWADKPISDGIAIDNAGNVYLGDLANNAIGVIDAERRYRRLAAGPRLSWIDAFSFGPDGGLYAVANQLHRSAVLNGGEAAVRPPFLVLRVTPLAPGVSGR